MAQYSTFINSIRTTDFGGFNAIEYADGGLEYYISFQAVLKWIGEYANLFSNGSEVIQVDWKSDKPMFMYSTTLSCDLTKCYVRNGYLQNTVGTYGFSSNIPPFKNIDSFKDGKYGELNQTLKEETGTIEDISIYPQIGNINYIYLSTYHLSQLIAKGSDNKDNKITIRKFLQDICDGVNKALGSINDLQVISDVDGIAETLTIIDYQQKRIKGIPAKFKESQRATTTLQTQGLGSMLTKIQAQSSITPELADMIAIGAQAQNQPVGEEATSFSLLSKGFTDRVYPAKTIGDRTKLIKQDEDRKKAIEDKYEQSISTYAELLENQRSSDGTYDPVVLKSTETSNFQNIAVELYKACLGMFTETGQTSTAFIPIKVNLSLYGISGIKIYQKFKLSNDVLPLSYKGDFEFIVLGVSHTVDSSKWETNISALITLADQPLKKSGPDKPFSIYTKKLIPPKATLAPKSPSLPSTLTSGYDTSKIRRQTISGLFVTNGEVPDEYMLELNNSPKYKGDLSSDGGRIRLLKPIMLQLEKLLQAYENDNPNTPIKINSAYRLYEDQVRVRKIWEAKGKANNAAYPGRSNHGFGRAVDFADVNLSKLTPSMRQYKWLKKNAGKYGFTRINRPGKPETWEAWHWEYLGDVGFIF